MAGLVMLPSLRQELALHPGPDAPDGSPTWTLHDPACNRFFVLSWPAFEILSRWNQGEATQILETLRRETPLDLSKSDIEDLLKMLQANHLLVADNIPNTQRLIAHAKAAELTWNQWLLKNYLFFRVPLLQPMHWLRRASPWVTWAFHPIFWMINAGLIALGLALATRRWDEFSHTLTSYANWEGILAIGLALSFAKVIHELGHAFAATRFGCRVPTMGIAFLVMFPVLYTDTTEAWKLRSRKQRIAIGAAGMLSELALASVALLLWSVLPESPAWNPVKSAAFLLATTTWVVTIVINASPFMRFDGYFLLADAVNMPNLHERAFAIGRWWLREYLFGLNEPPPERFIRARQKWLVVFAFATWIYRVTVFFGIALLVYHSFFKALGLALMIVELWWFITRPVWKEFIIWKSMRHKLHWTPALIRTAAILFGILCLFIIPWSHSVQLPAVLSPAVVQIVSAPHPSQIESIDVQQGDLVSEGQLLMRLYAPELTLRIEQAKLQEKALSTQLGQQPFDDKLRDAGPALRKQWEQSVKELAGLLEQQERLSIKAPFKGQIVELPEDLKAGVWIAGGEKLLSVSSLAGVKADAYANESVIGRIHPDAEASFIPKLTELERRRCVLSRIDPVQINALTDPLVADIYGGSIVVQRSSANNQLVPAQPTFHVRLEGCSPSTPPAQEIAGTVHIAGERRSIAGDGLRWLASIWHREVGF